MRFLADDPLKGRGTGTESYQIASTYVAAQFEALGLEPGSADSSYFQPVPLRRAVMVPDGTSLVLRSDNALRELQYAEDYLLVGGFSRTHVSVEAPVVFAGFGVTAPELGYDDYATVDAKGKIVAYLSDAPASSADLYFAVVFAEGCRYAVSLVCPA